MIFKCKIVTYIGRFIQKAIEQRTFDQVAKIFGMKLRWIFKRYINIYGGLRRKRHGQIRSTFEFFTQTKRDHTVWKAKMLVTTFLQKNKDFMRMHLYMQRFYTQIKFIQERLHLGVARNSTILNLLSEFWDQEIMRLQVEASNKEHKLFVSKLFKVTMVTRRKVLRKYV